MPISIRCSYSARVHRRVRAEYSVMVGTLRHALQAVNVHNFRCPQFQTPREDLGTALGVAIDWTPGGGPAVEADLEVRDVGESHLAQHIRGERRALAARAVDDDALGGIDLARVVVRRRIEPELEHATRHVLRSGNEAELAPLAHVADVQHLHVAAGHLGLDLLDREILDPRLRLFHHLPDGLPRLPHDLASCYGAPAPSSGSAPTAAKRSMSCRARSVSSYVARSRRRNQPYTSRWRIFETFGTTPVSRSILMLARPPCRISSAQRSASCRYAVTIGVRVTPPRLGSPARRACSPSRRASSFVRLRGR